MVAQDLVVTWEDAYRKYGAAVGNDITETSRAVAGAWRELAACEELPWWLSAAVRSAAQAFEQQAEAWSVDTGDAGDSTSAVLADEDTDEDADTEEDDEERVAYGTVIVPMQQGKQRPCACVETPPATRFPVTVWPVTQAFA